MNDEQLLRYGRQILLPEIDLAGQQKINAATVLLIGLGGLGSAIAYYLAGAGIGRLLLNDFDQVDASNLQRQIVYNESRLGENKAISARQTLQQLNSSIEIEAIAEKLDRQGLMKWAQLSDVIVDGSDNFDTRHLVNEVSLLTGKPLVSGAAVRMEGQLSVFNANQDSPCYQCLYGENQSEADMTCAENGVLAPLVGIIGSMQAMETLKLITGVGQTLDKRLLVLDGKTMEIRNLQLQQDPQCRCHQLRKMA